MKIPDKSPDYLTPMRTEREYIKSLDMVKEVNFNEIKARAKNRREPHMPVNYLRHLVYKGRLVDQSNPASHQFESILSRKYVVQESQFHK